MFSQHLRSWIGWRGGGEEVVLLVTAHSLLTDSLSRAQSDSQPKCVIDHCNLLILWRVSRSSAFFFPLFLFLVALPVLRLQRALQPIDLGPPGRWHARALLCSLNAVFLPQQVSLRSTFSHQCVCLTHTCLHCHATDETTFACSMWETRNGESCKVVEGKIFSVPSLLLDISLSHSYLKYFTNRRDSALSWTVTWLVTDFDLFLLLDVWLCSCHANNHVWQTGMVHPRWQVHIKVCLILLLSLGAAFAKVEVGLGDKSILNRLKRFEKRFSVKTICKKKKIGKSICLEKATVCCYRLSQSSFHLVKLHFVLVV